MNTWPAIPHFLDRPKLKEGVGLALSGGGYRAMVFHLGALIRLNELNWLPKLGRVSSVSGGSITAGVLAQAWPNLEFDPKSGFATRFDELVRAPLIRMARTTIDSPAVVWGLVPGISAAQQIANSYDKVLFNGATLNEITRQPRFVFNATSMQTGSLW